LNRQDRLWADCSASPDISCAPDITPSCIAKRVADFRIGSGFGYEEAVSEERRKYIIYEKDRPDRPHRPNHCI